jgi:ABC-type branched-subunit amino acid transport system substrate-binding protein
LVENGFRFAVKRSSVEVTNKLDSQRRFNIEGSFDERKACIADAVNVLSISNQQSSNNVITRESMAKTLRRTQGFNGAMGQFYFNNEGESGINFGVYTIVNGNARLIRTTP